MEILKQTVRYEVFDKMKGLAMMLVIMGHTHILARPIWTFHMPLFFILAGYFFRPKSVTESLKKDARRLLLPVLFVMAVMVLYGAVMYAFTGDKDKMLPWLYGVMNVFPFHLEPSVGIGPLWFLLAMYWCKNLFNMCHVLFKPAWGRWTAIASLVCLGLVCKDKWNVCCMAVGMHAMLFYGIGYIWKQSKDKLDAMSGTSKWVVVLLAFVLWLYCYCAADSFYELPSMTFPNGILLDSMAAFAMTFILYTLLSRIRFGGGYSEYMVYKYHADILLPYHRDVFYPMAESGRYFSFRK